MFETNVEEVTVEKVPLDFMRAYTMAIGKGIRIDSVESYHKEEKVWSGLQSEFFGTDFDSDSAFQERFSCKCKKYVGMGFRGKVCENCHTVVDYIDIDLERFGWIIIDHFKVVSPIYHAKLESALGSIGGISVFSRIIESEFNADGSKRKSRFVSEKELTELRKHPYIKKGMRFFYEHFDEIIDYYISKSKSKPEKLKLLNEIKEDKDKVFTSSIPVFSSILRMELPGEKDKKLYKMKINTIYQSIIRASNNINSFGSPDELSYDDLVIVDRYLSTIQEEIGSIFTEVYTLLTGKKGIIMGKIVSGRYDFSARNIIIPSSGRILRSNEIALGYITYAELFRYEITNLYAKVHKCTIFEADAVWKKSLNKFDPEIYRIMNYINDNYGSYVNILVNRNPSINYLSFQMMKVAYIKPNIKDKTMCIPSRNLSVLG